MRACNVPLIAAAFCAASLTVSSVAQNGAKQAGASKPAAAKDGKPDPFASGPWQIGVVEGLVRLAVFAVPQDAARRAQRQFPKQADLYAWLVAEMEKPAPIVRLERMDVLRVRNGQRSKLEGIDEFPYPTEYDPSQIPQTVGLGMPAAAATNSSVAPQVPGPPPGPVPAPAPVSPGAKGDANAPGQIGQPGNSDPPELPSAFPKPGPPASVPARAVPPWPYTQTTPSAYATKNAGWTCEMELTVSESGRTGMINLVPEFIKPAGTEAAMINAEEAPPRFETRQLRTELTAVVGKPTFAGTFNRPAQTGAGGAAKEDSTRLLFLTLTLASTHWPPEGPGSAGSADPFATPDRKEEDIAPADPFAEGGEEDTSEEDELKREGFLRLEAFSLPLAAARKALVSHEWEPDLYSWLDSEVSRNESGVALEHTSTLRVRDGERSKTSATMEYPYGTEYDPPQIPQNITLPAGGTAIPIPGTDSVFTPWPLTTTNASAFATKNLGWETEVEVTFGKFRIVDINIAPQHTRIVHKILYGIMQDIMQPVFETQKFNGQVITVLGRPSLISTFTPPTGTGIPGANTSDRVWFLFGTVNGAE